MKISIKVSNEAMQRYTKAIEYMGFGEMDEKYPVDAAECTGYLSNMNIMCGMLSKLSIPTNYKHSNKKVKNLKTLIGGILENVEYMKGFKMMADVSILTIIYCARHYIEIFTTFKRRHTPQGRGKGPPRTCITKVLADLVSK